MEFFFLLVPATVHWSYPVQTSVHYLKLLQLSSTVLKMSAADLMLCGSAADLDTACCHIPSSKQLTHAAVVVSAMVVAARGGRLSSAELSMHSALAQEVEEECAAGLC